MSCSPWKGVLAAQLLVPQRCRIIGLFFLLHGGQLIREFLVVCFMFDLLFSAQTGTFRLLTNGYCRFMGSPLANPVRLPFP